MRVRQGILILGLMVSGCAHSPGTGAPDELSWGLADPGTTRHAENECNLTLDLGLRGRVPAVYLDLDARNHSSRDLFIEPSRVRIDYTGEFRKAPSPPPSPMPMEIPPSSETRQVIALPAGTDLNGHRYLQVTVPVEDATGAEVCELHATLAKGASGYPAIPEHFEVLDTDLHPTRFEIHVGVGLPLFRTPHLGALGGSGPTIELMGTYFFSEHSGVSLLLGTEGYSSNVGSAVSQIGAAAASGTMMQLSESYFALNYSYQAFFSRHFSWTYSGGPGFYYFDLSGVAPTDLTCMYYYDCGYGSQDFGGAVRFMVSQQLALDYRFNLTRREHSDRTGVGVALYDLWIPYGSWGAAPVSGSSLGAFVFIVTGW